MISKELTAKQALGGIQLIRFSFPTQMNHKEWNDAINNALSEAYSTTTAPEATTPAKQAAAAAATATAPAAPRLSLPIKLAAGAALLAGAVGTLLFFRRDRSTPSA